MALTVRPTAALKAHPQWSRTDFEYFRGKGYSNQQILEFWDRDLRLGCQPLNWKPTDAKYTPTLSAVEKCACVVIREGFKSAS
jgi:hypothetical protein